ncbi:MAG: N-acetylneuraminate synthase family protein [Azoarcus sp.]|jgi:N-acetylneuraminate synthase|nr:N-acetylneuraminate synthase family protein [Azoarcus sp.]
MKAPITMDTRHIFEDLFVLELANNHWGRLERGLEIVADFSRIVRAHGVKAAIKLQFRDVDNFIHEDYRQNQEIRYVKKTRETRLSREDRAALVEAIRHGGCIPMATPFDEVSVDQCVELDIDIIKIASSDIADRTLIEKIAATRRPAIASTGGASLQNIDDLVEFFARRHIPLAINHCVSLYPTEDHELELNQIDFLKNRYPGHVIGFSTHEHRDWHTSIAIAYAKGARTFERHIDIEADGIAVSPYCSLPRQIDEWFGAYKKAAAMCGAPGTQKRIPPEREIHYLDTLARGVYARKKLAKGSKLTDGDNIYFAIPLRKGQISCRELMHGEILSRDIEAGMPVMIDDIDSPYSGNRELQAHLSQRGI